MIRELLPDMTDEEFREVMEITTDDIRKNRTKFGKETDLEEMLAIAKRSLKVLRKCNKVIERSGEMRDKEGLIKMTFKKGGRIVMEIHGLKIKDAMMGFVNYAEVLKSEGTSLEIAQRLVEFAYKVGSGKKTVKEMPDERFEI